MCARPLFCERNFESPRDVYFSFFTTHGTLNLQMAFVSAGREQVRPERRIVPELRRSAGSVLRGGADALVGWRRLPVHFHRRLRRSVQQRGRCRQVQITFDTGASEGVSQCCALCWAGGSGGHWSSVEGGKVGHQQWSPG